METLARWQHPKHGLLGPKEFFPAVEASGHMPLLGQTILHQALKALQDWDAMNARIPLLSINFSPPPLPHPPLAPPLSHTSPQLAPPRTPPPPLAPRHPSPPPLLSTPPPQHGVAVLPHPPGRRVPPLRRRGVVVRPRIHHRVLPNVVRQMRIPIIPPPRKLQHRHARRADR